LFLHVKAAGSGFGARGAGSPGFGAGEARRGRVGVGGADVEGAAECGDNIAGGFSMGPMEVLNLCGKPNMSETRTSMPSTTHAV
jgi:hypothetical protein